MKLKSIGIITCLLFSLNSWGNSHTGRLIVKIKKDSALPKSNTIKRYKKLFGELYVVYSNDIEKLERELKTNKSVIYIEKDFYGERNKLAKKVKTDKSFNQIKNAQFNDPKMGRLWAFADAQRNGMSINKAYQNNTTQNKEEIIVAVVDTGVDATHEDLKDVMWTNKGEIPGNGIDDDQNGYIDDIHGINTLIRDSKGNATVDIRDSHGHGTHVSGTIGAKQNNKIGIAGVASNVKIMGIRTVPNSSDELDVDIIEAFLYAARNGAKIINCSFGKSHNEGGMAVSETIDHIGEKYGVLVVVAAGNSSANIDRRLTYPASFENDTLLVVASTTSRGSMSYFSNYGVKNVDLAGPGSSIFSTMPNNRYGSMSGTSMASPNVAGVAAEVLSNQPKLTPLELKEALMKSVVKVRRFEGKVKSAGRADLSQTLQFL